MMAEEITIVVGESFAAQHENLRAQLGERYDDVIRETVEDKLHQLVKEVERSADQQQAQMQQMMPSESDKSDTMNKELDE